MALKDDLQVHGETRGELHDLLRTCGFDPPSDIALNGVLSKCRDVDLAFTALTMVPRPEWVEAIAGPRAQSTSG